MEISKTCTSVLTYENRSKTHLVLTDRLLEFRLRVVQKAQVQFHQQVLVLK